MKRARKQSKATKKVAKRTESKPVRDETDLPVTLIEMAEAELRAQLELVASLRLSGESDLKAAMATAAMTRALVGAETERRQKQKAEVREVKAIPLDRIVEFLKTLPESQRNDICREVSGADHEEPLL